MQQRAPQPARHVDHAVVVQELREVTAHRARGRGIGSAEVDQHHRGGRRAGLAEVVGNCVHRHRMTAAARYGSHRSAVAQAGAVPARFIAASLA